MTQRAIKTELVDINKMDGFWVHFSFSYLQLAGSPYPLFDILTMDNSRRGLRSNAGAGSKTSLAACLKEFKHQNYLK
jgi:hypothetical protein